jgi:hypothetical protein
VHRQSGCRNSNHAAVPDNRQPDACGTAPLTCFDNWLDALSVVDVWRTNNLLITRVALHKTVQDSTGQVFEHQHMLYVVQGWGWGSGGGSRNGRMAVVQAVQVAMGLPCHSHQHLAGALHQHCCCHRLQLQLQPLQARHEVAVSKYAGSWC